MQQKVRVTAIPLWLLSTLFLELHNALEELKASCPETGPDQTKTEKHPTNTTRDNVRTKFLIPISSLVAVSCHTIASPAPKAK